jgi:hypothetical protein
LGLILVMQIQSFMCRVYLFHNEDNLWSSGLHFHNHLQNGEPHYPRPINLIDYMMIITILLYTYLSCTDLHRLDKYML